MNVLISFLGILSVCKFLMGCSWIGHLMLVEIMMRGFTCHHVVLSACMSGLYLAAIALWVVFGNMLWQ